MAGLNEPLKNKDPRKYITKMEPDWSKYIYIYIFFYQSGCNFDYVFLEFLYFIGSLRPSISFTTQDKHPLSPIRVRFHIKHKKKPVPRGSIINDTLLDQCKSALT